MEETESYTAQLNEEGLETLERKLSIAASKIEAGIKRGTDSSEEAMILPVGQQPLHQMMDEIKQGASDGVKIAPQTEARPLIPLFQAAKVELPPEIQVDAAQLNYQFYMVQITFNIFLPSDQYPTSAHFELTLTDDVADPARRLRPIRLFPERKDIELFRADLEGAVGIDGAMNLSIPKAAGMVLPFGDVTADAKLKTGIVIGPLSYPFRNAAIEVTGESDQNVRWRYNFRSNLEGTNMFKSLLILKVAKEATKVEIKASLGVIPCKTQWLIFEKFLPELSTTMTLPVELVQR